MAGAERDQGQFRQGGSCQYPITSLNTFDDQTPHMLLYTGQVTRQGYDNMTGIGTPNCQAFISALRRLGG